MELLAAQLLCCWLALFVDLQAPGSNLEEVVPGVMEADSSHARDRLAAVHQVDASVVGSEHGRVDRHRRRETPAVEAHVLDAARAKVLHLNLEHRVTTGHHHTRVDGLHLDAGGATSLAICTCLLVYIKTVNIYREYEQ